MAGFIHPPQDDQEWEQAIQLLKRVYVGDGYTTHEHAKAFMRRELLEAGGELLVARATGLPVIGTVLYLFPNGPLAQVAREGEAEFRLLAVAHEAREQAIGAWLVAECIRRAEAEGAHAVVLWSQPTMLAAHRLYLRRGFVRTPERDQDDPRGFRRWVFRRPL